MSDKWIWFFALTGFFMSLANNIVGIWDLIIDMKDLKQDATSLRMEDTSDHDNGDYTRR